MKVIKAGTGQKGWSKEYKCTGKGNGNGGCGAILLVEAQDVFTTTSCARDETDYYKTFRCPECGVFTDISGAPSHVGGRGPVGDEKEVYNR